MALFSVCSPFCIPKKRFTEIKSYAIIVFSMSESIQFLNKRIDIKAYTPKYLKIIIILKQF